ncbi:MAG TPA: ScyD/ScyE family protein [Phototrophicaceae bacterium]|nr:ScyD/ScyE family protein [Phototrophicaceae bacterium]
MLRKLTAVFFLLCSLVLVVATQAQDAATEDVPVASGLNAPRHLRFGSDGTLYIAEAGFGGDLTAVGPSGNGEVSLGTSGRVSTVLPSGEQSNLIDGLLSIVDSSMYSEGVSDVLVNDAGDTAWLVLGQGPMPESIPADPGGIMTAVVKYTLPDLVSSTVIDTYGFEVANNPDGASDMASNPQEIAVAADGTIYIVDASANSLLSWTEADGLKLVTAWAVDESGATPSPVPSSLALASDGSLYVGFLSGYPFNAGGAKIEHWVNGALAETFEGLTLVTDVAVGQDGNLYAVQFADGFGQTGFNQNSGSVVQVTADGITPIMTGLNFPYGIAENANGEWFVSINSAFSAPGTGAVLKVRQGEVIAPASTPIVTPDVTPEA